MKREFNVTGNCNQKKHYMVDISAKLDHVMNLIYKGEYFAINRPRQYGKTTILGAIAQTLTSKPDEFILCDLSFEGIGDKIFTDESNFCPQFAEMLADSLERFYPEHADYIMTQVSGISHFRTLSRFISRFVRKTEKQIVLLIDEVDKSSNNQLFLSFLGMLRTKYLAQNRDADDTFQSVILAGVYDVKSLKLKIREGDEIKLNSPWNIAADFTLNMAFNPDEIKTMLLDYISENSVQMDLDAIAERIFYYTSGHPFLVSKLCKNIDEEAPDFNELHDRSNWTVADVDWSFRWLTRENYSTTNFEDLAKKLEDNQDLLRAVNRIILGNEKEITFSNLNPVVNLGTLYGLFAEKDGKTKIHNRVYEQILSDYIQSRKQTHEEDYAIDVVTNDFLTEEGRLDMSGILLKFQEFMKEHYSDRDDNFLEREGRLVFMSFLKPIVNGKGFMWKEPVVGDERRMDVVVTFGQNQKEVIELKIWRGESYHQKGLKQLSEYLDFHNLTSGYLLIFDFNKKKQYKSEFLTFENKSLHIVRL